MIGYVTLGSNDIPRAAAFYDELLEVARCGPVHGVGDVRCVGGAPDKPALGVIKPYRRQGGATVGNGVMVALVVDSNEKVDAVHRKAIGARRARTKARPARAASMASTRRISVTWMATSSTAICWKPA